MLRKWHVPTSTGYLTQESAEESEDDVPTWDNDREGIPTVGKTLLGAQKEELMDLVGKLFRCTYAVPMSQVYLCCTNVTEHSIDTRDAAPV